MRYQPSQVVSAAFCALVLIAQAGCNGPKAVTAERPTEAQMTNLLQQALDPEFIADREVIVTLVEIPPHTTLDRHWHPGEEFHYYLEGEVEIAIDGQPSIHGTPGTVGHVPLHAVHTAMTREKGARVIVFRVHTAGEPVRHLAEE